MFKMTSFTILLLLLSLIDGSVAYQKENLTETLVHLEHFAKEVRQEMISMRNNVNARLQHFKQKEFAWLQEYFTHKKDIPTYYYFFNDAERVTGKLMQELQNARRDFRLKCHKFKVVHGGHYNTESYHGFRKSKDVSFRSIDPLKTKVDGGENIILTNIIENTGNAFDNITGTFIAPVTGTYYFVLQLCLGGVYVDLSIQTGDDIFSWARFFPYYMSCQSIDMTIPLEKGDVVYPMKISSWDYDIMSDDNELYNTFSGVLLA